jgi:hypothetical protein
LLIQTWNTSSWVNAFQQNNSFDANGNNYQSFVSSWSGSAWVNYALIIRGYDRNNEQVSYVYELWNSGSATYVNSYQEAYQNTLGNVTTFENYNWNTVQNSWTPLTLNTYSFDENHNCIYEQDQSFNSAVDTFGNTDLYYYYYTSFTVSGIKDPEGDMQLNIAPNPSSGANTVVSFNADKPGIVSVNVYDAAGKLTRCLKTGVTAGANQLPLKLSDLAPGSYFVQVNDNAGKSVALKFIKQ